MEKGPAFRLEGHTILKNSIVTENLDGTTSRTACYAVCEINERIAPWDAEEFLRLLNIGAAARVALGDLNQ